MSSRPVGLESASELLEDLAGELNQIHNCTFGTPEDMDGLEWHNLAEIVAQCQKSSDKMLGWIRKFKKALGENACHELKARPHNRGNND